MDIDRPHFRNTSSGSSTAATTSELLICFTSRLSSSSSSMKLSKSILSPARAARDGGPTSLSSSHSRRLRTNGSLKGGQASPFFTTTGKKRGCAFENPEPSSPKVTCIGQVRVKTKKKVKQTRSLSKRRTSAAEVSFRKIEQPSTDGDEKSQQQQQRYSNASAHYQPQQECQPHRNQRWVHLPISICEALREFSCLLPCKSSCFSTNDRDKSEKHNGSNENGCGAVFARWLVSVNDGEGGKRREIELVVGGGDEEEQEQEQEQEDEEEERRVSMRTSRRHVFEDIEVKDDRIEMKGQTLEREEEAAAARVSICIPPKNALLLMRCRSDPMKMAALANRSTSNNQDQPMLEEENVAAAAPSHDHDDDDDGGKDEIFEQQIAEITTQVEDKLEIQGDLEVGQQLEKEELEIISSEEMVDEMIEETEMLVLHCHDEEWPAVEPVCGGDEEEEEEVESNMSSFEDLLEQENAEEYEDCCPIQDEEQVEEELSPPTQSDEEGESPLLLQESAAAMDTIPQDSTVSPIRDPDLLINNDEENQKTPPPETTSGDDEEEDEVAEEEEEHLRVVAKPEENQQKKSEVKKEEEKEKEKERAREREKERPLLPECLLLMMCEPKLSMEVSKETWVCSTDFTRWLPERQRRAAKTAKSGGGGEHETLKRRLSIDSKSKPIIEKNELQQPPRSSCSLPMASMIEQKLVNAVAYEPFVLTRCKSEPMRTAAVKLMPESCFWKNAVRKMEPHRCATMGVGAAAGVGF